MKDAEQRAQDFHGYAKAFSEIAMHQKETIQSLEGQIESINFTKEKTLDLELEILRLRHELKLVPLMEK